MKTLEKNDKSSINLSGIKVGSSDGNLLLYIDEFKFTPTYSENDKIPGATIEEAISNISQDDNLKITKTDDDRCGAASLINAYMLMSGEADPAKAFKAVAIKIGMPEDEQEFTFANVHKAQDKLFKEYNTEKASDGMKEELYTGLEYKTNKKGEILDAKVTGEVPAAAESLGMNSKILIGEKVQSINNKKTAVDNFFKENPSGVLHIGVKLDEDTGNISAPKSVQEQNHYITVWKDKDGNFMAANTGVLNNGNGSAVRKLTESEVKNMIYNTKGSVNGLSMKKE